MPIVLLIGAVLSGLIPLLRLGIRRWFPLVLLYTLWIGSFWGFVILRIYLPPENAFSAVVLAVVLLMLYFSYPILQGLAAHILYAHESGTTPSWRSAFLKIRDGYPRMLVVSSVIVLLYTVVVFGVYARFGSGWAEWFRRREIEVATYYMGKKLYLLWEGLLAGSIFSVFVDMLPPIIFPLGVFVGLGNPSSEFFFAMVVASLVAIGILFIPMLRFIFWLPLVTLKEDQSLSASLVQVWRASLKRVVLKEIAAVLRSFGLWFVLVIALALLPPLGAGGLLTGLTFSLGRWVAPAEMWGATPVVLGIFPGLISLILQHARIKLYRELFEAS